ncbi:MAG: 3-oxoacyl-ACP synthase [Desulfobacteraceae bacterium 4572_88]|nr:MAG: 3-oxoacyl-ACP synthase [Desulfobacteraceae bacterium 4572_88]
MRAIITGVGHFVPDRKLTNADLEKMVDTNDEWITSRTGIKERGILEEGKGTSHMAVQAAKRVLEQRNISADELDMIIVATVTPDMLVPSTAAIVQEELGAANCWGYDLNGGCSGFLFALSTASQFIETGKHQKVMVIGADKMSAILDYEDRNTCVIFGDAAGAAILEPSDQDDAGIRDFNLHLDGSGSKYLYVHAGGSLHPASHETVDKRMHYIRQDGKTVFKHAITGMAAVSSEIMKQNHLSAEDITFLIPHQANTRIIDAVAKKLKLSQDQVVVNIADYGNTTAATIPLAMSEAYQKKMLTRGNRIVLSAFGAGFAWGSLLLTWAMD